MTNSTTAKLNNIQTKFFAKFGKSKMQVCEVYAGQIHAALEKGLELFSGPIQDLAFDAVSLPLLALGKIQETETISHGLDEKTRLKEEFEEFFLGLDDYKIELPCKSFLDFVSKDKTREALTGVAFSRDNDFCATDGHKLQLKGNASADWAGILPIAFLKFCHTFNALVQGIYIKGNCAKAYIPGLGVVSSRLIDGPYPRVANVIPSSFGYTAKVPKDISKVLKDILPLAKYFGPNNKFLDLVTGLSVEGEEIIHGGLLPNFLSPSSSSDFDLRSKAEHTYAVNAEIFHLLTKDIKAPTELSANGPLNAMLMQAETKTGTFTRLIMPLRPKQD